MRRTEDALAIAHPMPHRIGMSTYYDAVAAQRVSTVGAEIGTHLCAQAVHNLDCTKHAFYHGVIT